MAEVLDNFEWRKRRGKYPWDQWFDGRIWKVIQGEDFDVAVNSMRAAIYQNAKNNGLNTKITVSQKDGSVIFQATPKSRELGGE